MYLWRGLKKPLKDLIHHKAVRNIHNPTWHTLDYLDRLWLVICRFFDRSSRYVSSNLVQTLQTYLVHLGVLAIELVYRGQIFLQSDQDDLDHLSFDASRIPFYCLDDTDILGLSKKNEWDIGSSTLRSVERCIGRIASLIEFPNVIAMSLRYYRLSRPMWLVISVLNIPRWDFLWQ